jgi:hypothetical protein
MDAEKRHGVSKFKVDACARLSTEFALTGRTLLAEFGLAETHIAYIVFR